jgi:hypothetical protein
MAHWHCGGIGEQKNLLNIDWDLSSWKIGAEWDSLTVFFHILCVTITYNRKVCRKQFDDKKG